MIKTMLKSNRFDKVGVGQVVTVNSAVVGDGRRTWRCGAVLSILGGVLGSCRNPNLASLRLCGARSVALKDYSNILRVSDQLNGSKGRSVAAEAGVVCVG